MQPSVRPALLAVVTVVRGGTGHCSAIQRADPVGSACY